MFVLRTENKTAKSPSPTETFSSVEIQLTSEDESWQRGGGQRGVRTENEKVWEIWNGNLVIRFTPELKEEGKKNTGKLSPPEAIIPCVEKLLSLETYFWCLTVFSFWFLSAGSGPGVGATKDNSVLSLIWQMFRKPPWTEETPVCKGDEKGEVYITYLYLRY